jgi:hypothetical protein
MAVAGGAEKPRFMPAWLRGSSLFFILLWFFVRDFCRSGWIALNIFAILSLQIFLPAVDPTRTRDFGLVYMFMLVLSAVNTMAIFSRINHSQTYAILARPVTRTTYVVTVIAASWVINTGIYLVVTAMSYLRYGPPFNTPAPDWFGLSTYLGASIPVLVAITFAVSLMSLLAAFVSPFWLRLLILAVITLLVMSFDPRTFPFTFMQGIVEHIPHILAPIVGALRFSTDSPPDSAARASLIILSAYTSTILALVLWLSTRRELVLD